MAGTMLDPHLREIKQALSTLYRDRLDRVVLYGSRARGTAGVDADYDVAVFLHDVEDPWRELDRPADLRIELMDRNGIFLDAKPFVSPLRSESPLLAEIERDGHDL